MEHDASKNKEKKNFLQNGSHIFVKFECYKYFSEEITTFSTDLYFIHLIWVKHSFVVDEKSLKILHINKLVLF